MFKKELACIAAIQKTSIALFNFKDPQGPILTNFLVLMQPQGKRTFVLI